MTSVSGDIVSFNWMRSGDLGMTGSASTGTTGSESESKDSGVSCPLSTSDFNSDLTASNSSWTTSRSSVSANTWPAVKMDDSTD